MEKKKKKRKIWSNFFYAGVRHILLHKEFSSKNYLLVMHIFLSDFQIKATLHTHLQNTFCIQVYYCCLSNRFVFLTSTASAGLKKEGCTFFYMH